MNRPPPSGSTFQLLEQASHPSHWAQARTRVRSHRGLFRRRRWRPGRHCSHTAAGTRWEGQHDRHTVTEQLLQTRRWIRWETTLSGQRSDGGFRCVWCGCRDAFARCSKLRSAACTLGESRADTLRSERQRLLFVGQPSCGAHWSNALQAPSRD